MTGFQGLMIFIGGPVIAVTLAVLANTRPVVILAAAVLGEVAAYVAARIWSARAFARVAPGDFMVAQATPEWGPRLTALAIFMGVALLVGALGIAARYAIARVRA